MAGKNDNEKKRKQQYQSQKIKNAQFASKNFHLWVSAPTAE